MNDLRGKQEIAYDMIAEMVENRKQDSSHVYENNVHHMKITRFDSLSSVEKKLTHLPVKRDCTSNPNDNNKTA